MAYQFIQTSKTRFRVRKETAESFVHPVKGKVHGSGKDARGEQQLAFVLATDPLNSVEHYDDLLLALLQTFAGSTVVIFELPGFALSKSTCTTATDVVSDLVDLVQKLKSRSLKDKSVGLVMPCVSGIFVPAIMKRLPDGVVSFVTVPQCGNYSCEKGWAEGVNSTGLLNLSIISRAFNYLRKKSITEGWYKAALPPRSSYAEIVGPKMSAKEACSYVRQRFTDIAYANFDAGGEYPLAYFLQILFYTPLATDTQLFDELTNDTEVIDVPTMALWGLQDRTHNSSLADESIMASFKQFVQRDLFRLKTIEDAAHFPELQTPHSFVSKLVEFLEEYALVTPGSDSKL